MTHTTQQPVHYQQILQPGLAGEGEDLTEKKNICNRNYKNKKNSQPCSQPRIKRSKMSLKKIKDFQFFDFQESHIEPERVRASDPQAVIQAHGVGGPGLGGEGQIFLSANNTVVETHMGTDTTLNCRIARDSDYGTVSQSAIEQDHPTLPRDTYAMSWGYICHGLGLHTP